MTTQLKLTVPDLAAVPAELQGFYQRAEDDSGYRLALEDEPGLLSALRKEREARKLADAAVRDAAKVAGQRITDTERELLTAKDRLDHAERMVQAMRQTTLKREIENAAKAAGLHGPAIPDALRACRELFDVDSDGNVVAVSGGRLTLATFFYNARDTAPHWFPATGSGGGAMQGASRSSGGFVMTRGTFDGLSPAQRNAVMRDGVKLTD